MRNTYTRFQNIRLALASNLLFHVFSPVAEEELWVGVEMECIATVVPERGEHVQSWFFHGVVVLAYESDWACLQVEQALVFGLIAVEVTSWEWQHCQIDFYWSRRRETNAVGP